MDETVFHDEEKLPEEEKNAYIPRPKWQIIGAWIALVLFAGLLIMYYVNLLRGGM